jgi:hypothetical protein
MLRPRMPQSERPETAQEVIKARVARYKSTAQCSSSGVREYPKTYNQIGRTAERKRSRSIYGTSRKCKSLFRPSLIDLVDRDLNIRECGQHLFGYVPNRLSRSNVMVITKAVQLLGRPSDAPRADRLCLSEPSCWRFVNVNHTFTCIREWDNHIHAFSENFRVFGSISRNRHFRFLIKVVTIFGLSKHDLKNMIRVRDLWLRRSKRFKKAIFGIIWSFPKAWLDFVSKLPRKEALKTSTHRRGMGLPVSRYTSASISPIMYPGEITRA